MAHANTKKTETSALLREVDVHSLKKADFGGTIETKMKKIHSTPAPPAPLLQHSAMKETKKGDFAIKKNTTQKSLKNPPTKNATPKKSPTALSTAASPGAIPLRQRCPGWRWLRPCRSAEGGGQFW